MKAPRLLRVTAVIMLLFGVGHTLGGIHSWSPGGETEVLRAMRTFHFDAEGASRTYLDFYRGFGFMLSTYDSPSIVRITDYAKASVTSYCIKFSTLGNINLAVLEAAIRDGIANGKNELIER